jgi:sugar-specific transcriptional regulator TrmB
MASLRDLGLSEYESRAYKALLRTGPTTAKELSRASDIPMGRIYDVLNSLEGNELARSQTASRPKRYAAVEPDTALDRLLAERKQELAARAEQYEQIVEELGENLETTDPEEPFWTAALGPEDAADLLVERIAATEDRIVMVVTTPAAQLDLDRVGGRVVDELERALDRGVSVSILMRPELVESLPPDIEKRYRRHLQAHEAFTVRVSEDVTGTFELIDGVEVCIEVPHPLEPEGTFAVIDLKDPEFAASVANAFRPRWEEATSPEL